CGEFSTLRMTDPMLDQMTRLKLKLLEKRLENERDNMDGRAESVLSPRSFDGQADALHSVLRRKKDLLQRLRDVVVRSVVKPRGNAVHHHHYSPQAQSLPPIGYPMWPSMMSSLPEGQGGAHMPSVQHVTGPITLPPLNMY
ncbi:unnamed protein product, partial [Coregonus sp. 'balchen']